MSLHETQILQEDAAALERAVGARIRQQRQRLELTLSELGLRCGLSPAFLSRLERGQATTTIAGLLQIARALSVEPQQLLADPQAELRVGVHLEREPGEKRRIGASDYAWQPISVPWTDQSLSAFILTFPAEEATPALVAHRGEEVCIVLDGEVLFEVEGCSHHLRPGDAIHLDSALPHRARALGGREARMAMVTTGAGRPQQAPEWWAAGPQGPAEPRNPEDQKPGGNDDEG